MKTKSLYFAALFVIGAAVAAVGKEEPNSTGMAVVAVKGSEVVKVIYKSETAGKVKLSVYDAASKIVFTETRMSNEGFILPLNFSGLQSGQYTVQLVDANGTKSEKINYQPSAFTKNVHVAKVAAEGKFVLSVVKGNSTVGVKIYDLNNNLVHESSKEVSGDYAQLFSIKNFAGATFEITNGGETSTFRF
ncbi:MAG TPA: T9SS type A sorting domain-containing protein [Chryseolinea sp.]